MTTALTAPAPPVSLPEVSGFTAPMLDALTKSLGINRNVLASDQQIENAWKNLPQLLTSIPPDLRSEGIMRMCVAVATGLFDSAVNYIWNAAIIELRNKVRRFGVHIVPQIIDKDFDEKKLVELQDSELLTLCLKLNLISETGYFMLDQCRDIRNNFSAAHPVIGTIDEYEFLSFLNRCSHHALSDEYNPTGVDIKEFVKAINASGFTQPQYDFWCDRVSKTFEAQRVTVLGMLHGIYCDPSKDEHARVNALNVCSKFSTSLSPDAVSLLVNQHQRYQAKGEQDRFKASQAFFEKLGLLALLSEPERHSLISAACANLRTVHQAMNNFYNEPPFAERVYGLSQGHQVPQTVRQEFVETVVMCSVGNQYGTCNAADVHYIRTVRGFSPREIEIMLALPDSGTLTGQRIKNFKRCADKFKSLVSQLQPDSVPTNSKALYEKWKS